MREYYQALGSGDPTIPTLDVEEADPRIPVNESMLRRLMEEKEALEAEVAALQQQNASCTDHIARQKEALDEATQKLEEQVMRNQMLEGEHATRLIDEVRHLHPSKASLLRLPFTLAYQASASRELCRWPCLFVRRCGWVAKHVLLQSMKD